MAIRIAQITGLILAGGRGTRMGGVDKGLQLLNGEPMVSHVLRRLRPQVSSLLINANRHLDQYQQFGPPLVKDAVEGFAGPLAGLHAGLRECASDYLVTAPCDSPLLPADLVARLSNALVQCGSDAAVATTGAGIRLQRHPVFLLVKASLLPQLEQWLAGGGRKVDDWLHSVNCAQASFDSELAFENINTTDQLADFSRRMH